MSMRPGRLSSPSVSMAWAATSTDLERLTYPLGESRAEDEFLLE
jgi:hypothetical protein